MFTLSRDSATYSLKFWWCGCRNVCRVKSIWCRWIADKGVRVHKSYAILYRRRPVAWGTCTRNLLCWYNERIRITRNGYRRRRRFRHNGRSICSIFRYRERRFASIEGKLLIFALDMMRRLCVENSPLIIVNENFLLSRGRTLSYANFGFVFVPHVFLRIWNVGKRQVAFRTQKLRVLS